MPYSRKDRKGVRQTILVSGGFLERRPLPCGHGIFLIRVRVELQAHLQGSLKRLPSLFTMYTLTTIAEALSPSSSALAKPLFLLYDYWSYLSMNES